MQVVAAEVIVIPRSRSWTIQSIVAAPSCTSPVRGRAGVEEDALGRGRLAGIDVSDDPDISRACAELRVGFAGRAGYVAVLVLIACTVAPSTSVLVARG